jgi:predicted O-methyltransferase YrrM
MTNRSRKRSELVDEALRDYVETRFAREDDVLTDLKAELAHRGFPLIHVSATTGKTLQVLVRAARAQRVLEVGTLGGYSAIWMARGMEPGGRLTTLEIDASHAALAREFVERAGMSGVIDIREGDARSLMAGLGPDGAFDLVFLDADKEGYVSYADHARRILRPGGLLIADNALWKGSVVEPPTDAAGRGIQSFNDYLASADWLCGTILPVGDGLAVGVKTG